MLASAHLASSPKARSEISSTKRPYVWLVQPKGHFWRKRTLLPTISSSLPCRCRFLSPLLRDFLSGMALSSLSHHPSIEPASATPRRQLGRHGGEGGGEDGVSWRRAIYLTEGCGGAPTGGASASGWSGLWRFGGGIGRGMPGRQGIAAARRPREGRLAVRRGRWRW